MDKKYEPIKYIGNQEVNLEFHHGGIPPAVEVNSFCVLRANREHPEMAEGTGWTYNHAPMMAYWNNKFYLEYLSNPVAEHVPPGHTLLTTSKDGRNFDVPKVVFPIYKIPDGIFEYDGKKLPDNFYAVMHQRMGFYTSKSGRLLVLGNYGISPHEDQVPFAKFSIGRVVREVYPDDTFGPIYFIRYNVGTVWNEENTNYPFYKSAPDKSFVEICDELLSDPFMTQQWAEEQGDIDPIITAKCKDGGAFYNKGFCWYKLPDGTYAGFWKWMKACFISSDKKEWSDIFETPTIMHAGAKIWAQKTSDGRYALVYNPTICNSARWPLAMITSDDGKTFDDMRLVIGDIPPRRYIGGTFKNPGFNYVRGILEENGTPPDGAMYVAYSTGKEDIWVSRIPVPVMGEGESEVYEDFSGMQENLWVDGFNTYCPKWSQVCVQKDKGGKKQLVISNREPYDYAKAEKVFKTGTKIEATVKVMAAQDDKGPLYIEFCDAEGKTPFRIVFDKNGELKVRNFRKFLPYFKYEKNREYELKVVIDINKQWFDVFVDGVSLSSKQVYQGQSTDNQGWWFSQPVKTVSRMVLRTGAVRRFPSPDFVKDDFIDLEGGGEMAPEVKYFISSIKIKSEK